MNSYFQHKTFISYFYGVLSLILASATTAYAAGQEAGFLARKGNAALIRSQNDKAIDSLTKALGESNLPIYARASILNDRGLAYRRTKNYENALSDFNNAIEIFPEFATAYNNRGILLHQLGHYREAIKDFNRAIALQPKLGFVYHNRANSLLKSNGEKLAFKDYGKAISLQANNAAPHLARGTIHMTHDRRYAALRELNQALSIKNKYAPALFRRSTVHLELGQTSKALNDAIRASEIDPKNIEYLLRIADLRISKRQFSLARNIYNQILTIDPLNSQALVGRARAQAARGIKQSSLEDLDLAISLKAGASAYAERALIQAKTGFNDLASEDMNMAIQNAPSTARSWVALGEAARLSGLTVHAERYFLEALKRDESNQQAKNGLQSLDLEVPISNEKIIGDENNGWSIIERRKKQYWALNPKYKKLEILLDMYGGNPPKILEWTVLQGAYKGFGLLRYDAGYNNKKTPYEHVIIINLKTGRVSSIEPYRWGSKIAKWTWKKYNVEIEDPDGIKNKVALLKPPKLRRQQTSPDNNWYFSSDGFWVKKKSSNAAKRAKKRRKKKKKKKLFGIFGY